MYLSTPMDLSVPMDLTARGAHDTRPADAGVAQLRCQVTLMTPIIPRSS